MTWDRAITNGLGEALPDDPPDIIAQIRREPGVRLADPVADPYADVPPPAEPPDWDGGPGSARGGAWAGEERSKAKKVLPTVVPPVADPAMFRGLLGDIVQAAEPTTEADSVGVLASLLVGTGVLLGSTPHVRVGNTRHPLLIWAILFGRTGSGRKGEATDTALTFLHQAAKDDRHLFITGLSSGEGLIERIRDVRGEDDNGGTEDKRLFLVEPEFAAVMSRSRREGSTLGAVLREAWSGKQLATLNRSATVASSSHVGIIGHIPPKEFRLRVAESDMSGGTYNRYLPIYVERSKRLPVPDGVDDVVVQTLSASLRKAIREGSFIGRVQLDGQAVKLWKHELYDEFTEADDEDAAWTEFARRAAPYALRIAALYAVLDRRTLITVDDLTASAALVRYGVDSAKFVLDRTLRNPRLDRLRRALDGAPAEGLSRQDISALFSRKLPSDAIEALLGELSAEGAYGHYRVPTRGRPREMWRRTT